METKFEALTTFKQVKDLEYYYQAFIKDKISFQQLFEDLNKSELAYLDIRRRIDKLHINKSCSYSYSNDYFNAIKRLKDEYGQ